MNQLAFILHIDTPNRFGEIEKIARQILQTVSRCQRVTVVEDATEMLTDVAQTTEYSIGCLAEIFPKEAQYELQGKPILVME